MRVMDGVEQYGVNTSLSCASVTLDARFDTCRHDRE